MEEQYKALHQALADKHKIRVDTVFTVRSMHLGYKLSRAEIGQWCAKKMAQPRQRAGKTRKGRREHGLLFYQDILNFIAGASEETWQDTMKEIT